MFIREWIPNSVKPLSGCCNGRALSFQNLFTSCYGIPWISFHIHYKWPRGHLFLWSIPQCSRNKCLRVTKEVMGFRLKSSSNKWSHKPFICVIKITKWEAWIEVSVNFLKSPKSCAPNLSFNVFFGIIPGFCMEIYKDQYRYFGKLWYSLHNYFRSNARTFILQNMFTR